MRRPCTASARGTTVGRSRWPYFTRENLFTLTTSLFLRQVLLIIARKIIFAVVLLTLTKFIFTATTTTPVFFSRINLRRKMNCPLHVFFLRNAPRSSRSCYVNGSERSHRHLLPLVNNVEYRSQKCPFVGRDLGLRIITVFWPHDTIHQTNGISIGSSVFAALTAATNTHGRIIRYIGNNSPHHSVVCVQCGLK